MTQFDSVSSLLSPFIAQIIVGDVPDISLGDFTLVDDLVISAIATDIDGEGNILGQAGPINELLREASRLPTVGGLELNAADLDFIEEEGLLEDLFLHEMGHVIGIGTLWEEKDLLRGAGGNNPRYIGENGTAAFNEIFDRNARSVPVESLGGEGTRDAHWRASVFGSELMIGVLTGEEQPLSLISAASLIDLGYEVNQNAAEPYSPSSGVAG